MDSTFLTADSRSRRRHEMGASAAACLLLALSAAGCMVIHVGGDGAKENALKNKRAVREEASGGVPGAAAEAARGTAEECFPPEALDHLKLEVSAEVEIAGIGKDRVTLTGTAVVHRSGPRPPQGRTMVGDLVSAVLRGHSDVFGEIVAIESPLAHSPLTYTCIEPGRYQGELTIRGWWWLPAHGDLWVYAEDGIKVAGEAGAIPPVGQHAEQVDAETPLRDLRKPSDPPIGFVRGAEGRILGLVSADECLAAPSLRVNDVKAKP